MTTGDLFSYPPRGLSREAAARYIGVGATTFDRLVGEGRMPKPLRIGKRVIWDRLKVEAAFNDLDDEDGENSIDRAVRLAALSAGEASGAPKTTSIGDDLLKRHGLVAERDLAAMLGVSARTLRNRGADLPTFVRIGHRRLYHEASVREYLERKTVRPRR